ncbi:MAG TPA: hypothetical protein DCQ34_11580 [Chitinophagaceae bacterium]|nr:hypothetical protein [Chitinophagaceae bacterium]
MFYVDHNGISAFTNSPNGVQVISGRISGRCNRILYGIITQRCDGRIDIRSPDKYAYFRVCLRFKPYRGFHTNGGVGAKGQEHIVDQNNVDIGIGHTTICVFHPDIWVVAA